jgi:hypothetical protein
MVLMFIIQSLLFTEAIHRLSYSQFKQLVRDNKVESLVLAQDEIRGRLKEVMEIRGRTTRLFTTVRVDAWRTVFGSGGKPVAGGHPVLGRADPPLLWGLDVSVPPYGCREQCHDPGTEPRQNLW